MVASPNPADPMSPTTASPGSLSTPAAPPSPPTRRPNRRVLYIIAGAAVVVVVLLLAVVLLPSSSSPSSNPGGNAATNLTYSQAAPIAGKAVSGYAGGGWALLFAVGLDSNTTESFPANATSVISSNCTFTASGSTSSLTLPGTSVSRSAGESPAWEFAYRNGAGTIAVADVLSGQGSVLGTLSGMCVSFFGLLAPVPSHVIDSSVAAAAVEPNASSFLTAHPNASAEFGLIGGVSFLGLGGVGAEWSIDYSTCSLSATATGTGATFNATVNATTGKVLNSTTSTASCSSSGTTDLGSSIAFNSISTVNNPPYTNYTLTATSASNGVTWDNFTVQIESGGTPVTTGWTANATSSTNVLIASYDPATATWSAGGSHAVVAGDVLVISTTANLAGDDVVFTGVNGFSGTISMPL
jgi:hypothetical protein